MLVILAILAAVDFTLKVSTWSTYRLPVNWNDPAQWILYDKNNKIRIVWLIFFSAGAGLFLAFWAQNPEKSPPVLLGMIPIFIVGIVTYFISGDKIKPIIPDPIVIKYSLPVVCQAKLANVRKVSRTKHIPISGMIYIMRRDDGVLKFGKTYNLRKRLANHQKDYEAGFAIIATWAVTDVDGYEVEILRMSKEYFYTEGRRKELRKMDDIQLSELVTAFTEKVYDGYKKAKKD